MGQCYIMCIEVSSTILDGPRNITSFSQSTVNFTCTSDRSKDIYWKYAAYASASTVVIFDSRGRNDKLFDERFVKTVNGSSSILTIRNVQTSDTGVYICHEKKSVTQWTTQLAVIGKLSVIRLIIQATAYYTKFENVMPHNSRKCVPILIILSPRILRQTAEK